MEHVEDLEHKRPAFFLTGDCEGDLGEQQRGDIEFLVLEIRAEVEPAVGGDQVHAALVLGVTVFEIGHGQQIARFVSTVLDLDVRMRLEKLLAFLPARNVVVVGAVVGREGFIETHERHADVLVVLAVVAQIGHCLYEPSGTLCKMETAQRTLRVVDASAAEKVQQFDQFEEGPRQRAVAADGRADAVLFHWSVDILVWIGQRLETFPFVFVRVDLGLDFR